MHSLLTTPVLRVLITCLADTVVVPSLVAPSLVAPSRVEQSFQPTTLFPPMPPITTFRVVSGNDAYSLVEATEMVMGITIGESSRAYPLNMISGPTRELLNDQLGNQPIAVTLCDLCQSATVYDRQTKHGILEFGIAGQLWHRNMVMYDTRTKSLWCQMTGKSMDGTLVGTTLERLPCDVVSWKGWKASHPNTTVAIFERTKNEYVQESASVFQAMILCVVNGERARAWTYSKLRNQPLIHDTWVGDSLIVMRIDKTGGARVYSRRDGTIELTFLYDGGTLFDEQTRSTWDSLTGRSTGGPLKGVQLRNLPSKTSLKNRWEEIYPGTEYYR